MVQSACRFGRLVTAVVVAYWFTVLVGPRALPRGSAREVLSSGRVSEFLLQPPSDAARRLDRLLNRVAHVLVPSRLALYWHLQRRRRRPRPLPA